MISINHYRIWWFYLKKAFIIWNHVTLRLSLSKKSRNYWLIFFGLIFFCFYSYYILFEAYCFQMPVYWFMLEVFGDLGTSVIFQDQIAQILFEPNFLSQSKFHRTFKNHQHHPQVSLAYFMAFLLSYVSTVWSRSLIFAHFLEVLLFNFRD